MNEHCLTELQKKLLDMLAWFDMFCRENDLTYYALGGTLLGAVRHQGFIPWDDDIDVGMPREDYIKLEKLMKNKKYGDYILETQNSSNVDFCYPYTKLYDTSTTLIENYHQPLVRGVFLDIFPLDGLGNDYNDGMNWFKKIYKKNALFLTRVAAIRKNRATYKNIAVILSRMIPNFIIDNVNLRKEIDKMCQKYSLKESTYGGNLLGNWGEREITPVEIISEPVEYQFENIKIYGFKDYDAYLTQIYGDWRKLPPKEKQVTHHDFVKLNLNDSYLN